ncbi:serine protease inhibitor Cvsi-2-like [Mizuhopecten yessoensis]|uniref:Uncharacterized protein n=1 Tax=Mizuhopecten yessoensis TaxID=6573 RepID=A0A210Q938_MIZYE|nr:serine protease inhibitor Cvsi-2-like [Mizuhopecten yessoensis]OWF45199.1 hypothetical protein KP79_PYT23596 [Mizuhopecten yessoensis]
MKFLIVTACLAAYVVFVISERCHEHDDLEAVCVLTACNGNNTKMICEHDECTCAVDTDITCQQKSDCEHLPSDCDEHGPHHPPHHRRAPPKPGMEWHCLDSRCKCF